MRRWGSRRVVGRTLALVALIGASLIVHVPRAGANACNNEENVFAKDTAVAQSRISTQSAIYLYNNTTNCSAESYGATTHLSTGYPGGDFAEAGHRTYLSAFAVYYRVSFGEIEFSGNTAYNSESDTDCASEYGTEEWVTYRVYWQSSTNKWLFQVDCGGGFSSYKSASAASNFNVGSYAFGETFRHGDAVSKDAHNAEKWLDVFGMWHNWSGHGCLFNVMTGGWKATTALGGYVVTQNPSTWFC
jgi:hypothetical protein